MRIFLIAFILLARRLPRRAPPRRPRWNAAPPITDPATLRELDGGRFAPRPHAVAGAIGGCPACQQRVVRLAVDGAGPAGDRRRVRSLHRRHRTSLPKETIGVGEGLRFPVVRPRRCSIRRRRGSCWPASSTAWTAPMLAEASCGEIRLIYRLTRTEQRGRRGCIAAAAADDAEPRAEGEGTRRLNGAPGDHLFRDRRSLARSGCGGSTEKLSGKDGPLDLIVPENIDRIETNLQIAHAPKSAVRDFRTDYLLKVFRYDRQARVVRGSADGKPDRPRADSGRRWSQARVQGVAARSRQSSSSSIAAPC